MRDKFKEKISEIDDSLLDIIPKFSIDITIEEGSFILKALTDMPYDKTEGLVNKIQVSYKAFAEKEREHIENHFAKKYKL